MSESGRVLSTAQAVIDAMSSCRIEVKEVVNALGGRRIVIIRKGFALPVPCGSDFGGIANGELTMRSDNRSVAFDLPDGLELPAGLIGVHNVGPFDFDTLQSEFHPHPAYEPKTPQD